MIWDEGGIPESDENKRIYDLWHGIIRRCYSTNENDRLKMSAYNNVQVCPEWSKLSNFVEDIKQIKNYDLWLNDDEKYEIDKDILCEELGIHNKIYSKQTCQFITKTENSTHANLNRDYSSITGENSPLYGKKLNEETRKKISERMTGENSHWYGKKHKPETIEKMKNSAKYGDDNWMRKYCSGENHPYYGKRKSEMPNARSIIAKNLKTGEEYTFPSILDASEGISKIINKEVDASGITKVCKYNEDPSEYMKTHTSARKSVAGFTFYYKNNKGDR